MFEVNEFDQLERFNAITNLSNALNLTDTNTPAWLCLWFADLSCIRQLIEAAKNGVNRALIREIFDADSKVMSDMLRACKYCHKKLSGCLLTLVLGMDCEESPLRSYAADSDDDSSETSTVEGDDGEAMVIAPCSYPEMKTYAYRPSNATRPPAPSPNPTKSAT